MDSFGNPDQYVWASRHLNSLYDTVWQHVILDQTWTSVNRQRVTEGERTVAHGDCTVDLRPTGLSFPGSPGNPFEWSTLGCHRERKHLICCISERLNKAKIKPLNDCQMRVICQEERDSSSALDKIMPSALTSEGIPGRLG